MSLRSLMSVLALVAFLGLGAANAATPLEIAMKQMSSAYKELSIELQQPHEAYKSHYLSLVGVLGTEAQTSRGLVPKKAEALPADQRSAMVKAYQKGMDGLIQGINLLTRDIENSRWDDARGALVAIKQRMTYGHEDFRAEE